MIRRILNAYALEYTKYSRQSVTLVGPILILVLVVLAPLGFSIERDEISDYGFIAYSVPMALNFFGFLMVLVFSSSLVAAELGNGTLRMILVRPLRRSELLAAKMQIGMTYALVLTLITSVGVWTTAFLLGDLRGIEYGGELVFTNGEMLQAFVMATVLNLVTLWAGVAWGLMFSTLTRNAATAIGLSVGSWLLIDFLKHPLNIAPFFFSSYLDQTWGVFSDRCAAFETSFLPEAYYGLAAALGTIVVCLGLALIVLNRRNLGS